MPIDVIYGETHNPTAARGLARALQTVADSGTAYIGYPVLMTAEDRVEIDVLFISEERGLVAFLLDDIPRDEAGWQAIINRQDRLFTVLDSYLRRYEMLRAGRGLAVVPNTATVFPGKPTVTQPPAEGFYGDESSVREWVSQLDSIPPDLTRKIKSALERVTNIKPSKRRTHVVTADSRGAKIKLIEQNIANLDQWQNAAAIETPDSPQRIRGLAGSGKTVVLALKAAYLHSQQPDWDIAVTYYTRALSQQIENLVTRFTFEQTNDQPDPARLKIIPTWGSRNGHGVYSLIAEALGEVPRDWAYAKGTYGQADAFQGICNELLVVGRTRELKPLFDAVLIDEAQDLPPAFFQLVYMATREPKRIVWAYDELQRLSETTMPDTDELFGTTSTGESLVSLESQPEGPRRDIVLPVCYRNTPWALATAHALGLGMYRATGGLLQHPDDPELWRDIGYETVHGSLTPGKGVTLARRKDSYPPYFDELLEPHDSVFMQSFPDSLAQDQWIAEQINRNLTEDELEADDILIVLPDPVSAKNRAGQLSRALRSFGIDAHLVGVTSSAEEVFRPNSVAMAQIYRAKGNEAPMVYAVDAQRTVATFNEVTRRNTLFTAITRSRAWVRITGWGEDMDALAEEIRTVVQEKYQLRFKVPTAEELATIRHIHRERPREFEATVKRTSKVLNEFLEAVELGDLDFDDLPADVRERLEVARRGESNGANN